MGLVFEGAWIFFGTGIVFGALARARMYLCIYYTQNPPGEWAENNPRLKVSLLLIRLLTITNFSFKLIVFNTNNY